MIVSARCLLASARAVRRPALAGPRARATLRDVRERPKWALILGAHRGGGAVPADHLRRARRAERADRGADLARVAVRRAAGAVHPARASRSTAARASGMLLGLAGVALVVGVESVHSLERVPGRAGDDRRGVLLRALELRRQGPLRHAGARCRPRGSRVTVAGIDHAAGRASPRRPATRRRSARSPRSSSSASSAPRSRSSSTTS